MILTELEIVAMGKIQAIRMLLYQNERRLYRLLWHLYEPQANRRVLVGVLFRREKVEKPTRNECKSLLLTIPETNESNRTNGSGFDITCNCSDFVRQSKCVHLDAVIMDTSNRMRITALGVRVLSCSSFLTELNRWYSLKIPVIQGDNVLL